MRSREQIYLLGRHGTSAYFMSIDGFVRYTEKKYSMALEKGNMQKAGKFSHFCESQRTEKGGRKYKKHSEGICLANFVFWLHMAFIYSYVQFMNTVCYHRYGQHYLGPLRKPGHPAPLKPLPAASVWGGQSNISSLSALLCQRKQRNLNT